MKQIAKNLRCSKRIMSLIVLAFSFIGLLNINEAKSTNTESNFVNDPLLTTLTNDYGSVSPFDDQESVFVADGDTVIVQSFGTDLSYDITEIRAKAGSTITIRYENVSDMPHNIVLVKSRDDIQPVGVAGMRARDTGYVPQGDENQARILANTELAKPGNTVHVTITVPDPGIYPYICTYPGHFTMMQGDLISE